MCKRLALLLSATFTLVQVELAAQLNWHSVDNRFAHAMATDRQRGTVVVAGGRNSSGLLGDTWSRSTGSGGWQRQQPANNPPPPTEGLAMSFYSNGADSARVVRFGGNTSAGIIRDSWSWDGNEWIHGEPLAAPPARQNHAMTYDYGRLVVVLFGGQGIGLLNDTWEYTEPAGLPTWSQVTTTIRPGARFGHGLVYDQNAGKTLLFGGSGFRSDTWEFDGTSWTQRTPASAPSGRMDFGMAFDELRGEMVLFGGLGSGGVLNDTWVWDGSNWTQRTVAAPPPARSGHRLEYDITLNRVLLLGGKDNPGNPIQDTWLWNGANSTWTRYFPPPAARAYGAMAYDELRGQVVLFGGGSSANDPNPLGDTWLFDGLKWYQPVLSGSTPGPRFASAMVFDRSRGEVLLVAGRIGNSFYSDTWAWNGSLWLQHFPTNSAPAMHAHAMAYDAARQEVVLRGGSNAGGFNTETWIWSGTAGRDWHVAPSTPGPINYYAAMTYDERRQRCCYFGGSNASGFSQDLWEWNGTTWTLANPVGPVPFRRRSMGLVYDAYRDRTVLFGGGFDPITVFNDLWDWDGTSWTQRQTPVLAPPRLGHTMVFDPRRRVVLGAGGVAADQSLLNDTWELALDRSAAADLIVHGNSCQNTLPQAPQLGPVPFRWPWIGSTHTLRLTQAPVGLSFVITGLDENWIGGIPLAGFPPGCLLYQLLDVVTAHLNSPIDLALFPIPNDPLLIGGRIVQQAFVLDTSPAATYGFTNAVRVQIGQR